MTPGRQPSFHSLLSVTVWARSRVFSVRVAVAVAVFAVVLLAAVGAVVGTGTATVGDGQYAHGNGTDSTPPAMANGTRINDTAVAVTITDNHDVDESSIEAADFLLSDGSMRNISVSEDGSDATVTLLLDRKLNTDELTVVLQSEAVIRDTNGNELTTSSGNDFVIVDGMDSIPPAIKGFTVTNATGGPATIEVGAREPIGELSVAINGPNSTMLNVSDFEETDSRTELQTTYAPPTDGSYRAYLVNVTDRSGNTRQSARSRQFIADLTPPDAVATLDLAASRNLTMAFDASQSADASGIAQYRWSFGDGDTATGPRVTHEYLPGEYTVDLNVTDIYGNTASDSLTLNLTRGAGNATDISESELRERTDSGVSVARPGDDTTAEALVSVDNARRNEAVAVGTLADGEPLAARGPVSLDGLRVTLATNRSFDLGISLAGDGAVSDAATAGRIPVGGLTVVNTVPDDEIANATVAFGVERNRLDSLGVTPANVSLYRFHDGSWNALPTTPTAAANGTHSFRAETPGFSRFAVAATPPTSPDITVTDATLDAERVEPGTPFEVTATLENSGTGDGAFVAALEANGAVVATSREAIAAGGTATVTLQSTTTDTGTYELSVNGTTAGTLTVAASQSDANGTNGTDGGESPEQFVVTNASLPSDSVDVDEPFAVEATVENRGDERGNYTAALAVNGSVVMTETQPVPAGETATIEVNYLINRSGEFALSVNGTRAGTLTVGDTGDSDGGGGGLLAPLFGLLGALPMGLARTAILFVVAPLAVVYGVLKGLAIYLGY